MKIKTKTKTKTKEGYDIVSVSHGDYKYVLDDFAFRGVDGRYGKNIHRSTKYDWRVALDELSLQPGATRTGLLTYVTTNPLTRVSRVLLRNNLGGITVGCHDFSNVATVKIARWAGWDKTHAEHVFPKVKKEKN